MIASIFHALYEIVRILWPVFFIGWWVFCLMMAKRTSGETRKTWIWTPGIFTAIGIVISLLTTSGVYSVIRDPSSASALGNCGDAHPTNDETYSCEMERRMHFRSLAVMETENQEAIAFLPTYLRVFGDTVSFVQITWLWLALPAYLFWRKRGRSYLQPPERDFIRIKSK